MYYVVLTIMNNYSICELRENNKAKVLDEASRERDIYLIASDQHIAKYLPERN
jgi:hypothetical protein